MERPDILSSALDVPSLDGLDTSLLSACVFQTLLFDGSVKYTRALLCAFVIHLCLDQKKGDTQICPPTYLLVLYLKVTKAAGI